MYERLDLSALKHWRGETHPLPLVGVLAAGTPRPGTRRFPARSESESNCFGPTSLPGFHLQVTGLAGGDERGGAGHPTSQDRTLGVARMTSSVAGSSIGATSLRSQSELYMSTIGTRGVYRTQTFFDKLREFKDFLFDEESGKIFNRSPLDLVLWIVLHVVLFAACCLGIGFFLWVHYYIINWNVPMVRGGASLVQTPGLSFRPQPDHMSTTIRFVKGDESTYMHYTSHLNAYMEYYENENQQGENYIDCSEIRERRGEDELEKVCRFNIEWLGTHCVKQQNYGFNDGHPCILLKLNKVYNWRPQEYSNRTVPPEIASLWRKWSVTVRCDGETAADRENMGPLEYYPEGGFHFRHFPYRNQQGYRSPLVFVRFTAPTPGSLMMINCKAYAKNIQHDRSEMVGMTRFELLVD